MKLIKRPIPIENEIILDPMRTIMSKTDKKGIIEFANDYFMEISGYKEWELMGQPHNVIRHPDMPKVIFKLLWKRLENGQNIHAIVKNLAKDGSYYWVVTDFQTTHNTDGTVRAYYSRRKAIPQHVKAYFNDLYKLLLDIEKTGGMEASYAYLYGLLEDKNISYDNFILEIFGLSEKELTNYMKAQISDKDMLKNELLSPEEAIKKNKRKGFLSKFF